MAKSVYALSRVATIINELGLHARAASKIAALAQQAQSKIWILKDDQKADASSILDVLTLVCPQGSEITLTAEERSDIEILNRITELVKRGFGE